MTSQTPVIVVPRNAHQWRQIGDFLEAQWLASFGLQKTAASIPGEYFGLSLLQRPK